MAKKLIHSTPVIMKKTLQQAMLYEETIQRSKFVVNIRSVSSFEDGMTFLDEIRDNKATHNCWAYRGGDESNYRIQDDGEPSGTAGKPILTAIDSMNLVNTMAIVTRYLGGIKLGTGGLIRAYQGVTRNCLEIAEREGLLLQFVPTSEVRVTLPTDLLGRVYHIILKYGRIVASNDSMTEDNENMAIQSVNVEMPSDRVADFCQSLQDLSKGAAAIIVVRS